MNILFIVNELRYTCGVTNHILHLSKGLTCNNGSKLFILSGGGNGIGRFSDIPVEIIDDRRFLHSNRSSVNYISAINYLSKIIKKNKIDIIHSHTHYGANIAAHASVFRKPIRIQTNHGILIEEGTLKHFNADKYIAINEHIYNYLLENKIAVTKDVKLIRCGIPIPDEPAVKQHAPIKVIAASRFTKEKGIDTYIRAVSKLRGKTKQEVQFLIAGEGDEENELIKLNKELNAGAEFLGRVVNLGELLRDTHILVCPTRSVREGFPAIVTEAGAYNNILVSSAFKGAESVLMDNVNCMLFEIDNAEELSRKLLGAINDYSDLSKLALQFHNDVKKLYDLDTMIVKHEEFYKECLNR